MNERAVTRTRRALVLAYRAAIEEARAGDDLKAAYDAVTELAEVLREMADGGAEVRALLALAIYNRDRLTFETLGEVLGVSQSRAGQLVKAGREAEHSERKPIALPPEPPRLELPPSEIKPEVKPEIAPARPRRRAPEQRPAASSNPMDWRTQVRQAAVRWPLPEEGAVAASTD